MIEVVDVSKSLGKKTVLSKLNFKVPQGDTVALLGLSGSGKTTALKLVCGLHLPDQGQILVDGVVLKADELLSLRIKIGYVIQDGGLFPHLTAYQNISLVGNEAEWDKDKIRTRIEELALLVKIPMDLLRQYPRELSGGQRQRVGIMRAMLLDPPILLLDEPMGALDPITRHDLQLELKTIFAELKKTVLLVTHDLYEAGLLADCILLLDKGQVVQQGTMHELVTKPQNEFVRRFVSSQTHDKSEWA